MVTHEVVHKGGTRVPVPPNGYSLIDTVSVQADDVVQFVAHATGT